MDLEVRAVRHRGEEMHGQVVHAVRGDREIERLGEVRDLNEHRDAAAVRHVGLRIGDAADVDHLLELPQRAEVLAGRDRHAALAHDARVPRDVVGDRRLLEPDELELAQQPRGADRVIDRPAHVGVGHQREVGAEVLPHLAHALDVLGELVAADLHLDRAEALRPEVVGLAEQPVERELEVDPAGVARHARIEAAEHPPQRLAGALGREVPERDVDRRDRQHHRPAAAAVVERPPHLLPQRLDPAGVLALEQRREVALDEDVDRGAAGADGVGVAEPLGAVRVAHAHRDELEVGHLAVRAVREHHRQRHPVAAALDGGDLRHRRYAPAAR